MVLKHRTFRHRYCRKLTSLATLTTRRKTIKPTYKPATMSSSQKSSSAPLTSLPNCGLPPELWLYIATLLLPPYTSPITFTFTTPKTTLQALVRQPALLRASKALRTELLKQFYSTTPFIIIGDTNLPPSLEGRTGFLPPNFQAWITAIGLANRECLGKVWITHFAPIPVGGGWIDGSVVSYRKVARPRFEDFGEAGRELEESGFVFRPWTVRVEFETRVIRLVDSRGEGD